MSRVCVRVRPAEVADVAGLVELTRSLDPLATPPVGRAAADGDGVAHLQARLEELIGGGTRRLLVAIDDSTEPSPTIAGLLIARVDEVGAIDLTSVLHISHLVVAPTYRRRGVGRALLAAAAHLAEEYGVERVLATVASGSREGNRYLARLGFAPLVVHRVVGLGTLRRALGLADEAGRMAVLRRARLIRAQRGGLPVRAAGSGG